MPVEISGFYCALLAIIGITLQLLVGRERFRSGISLGDGGDTRLQVAIRRQANFIEQVPLALLLLVVAEINGAPGWWLHLLGVVLLTARVIHPLGLDTVEMRRFPRFIGSLATILIMFAAIVTILAQ